MRALKRTLIVAVAITLQGTSLASAQFERDPAVMQAFEAGQAAMQAGDWEAALQAFQAAIDADDGTFDALFFGKAEALREMEDYKGAIQAYQKAIQINDQIAQYYNGRGICYREDGNLEMAFIDFFSAADLDRRNGPIAANLGDILINNPQPDPVQAMPYLDRAIEDNPEDAEAYRNRGWAHTLLREFEEGITDLQKAAELDPTDYETYERLANVYLAEEEIELSIAAISNAIQNYEPEENSDPDIYVNGFLQRAASRMSLAKDEEISQERISQLYKEVVADANAVLEEYPDRFPESGLAQYRLGTAKRMQGLFGEAITAFTDAIQLIPAGSDANFRGEAYLIRGICWFYLGQNSLARGDFKEAASIALGDPRPHLWIGYTYAEEGDYRKAIESYGEATANSPNFALAYTNRGLAYMQLEDYKKAIDNFDQAIRSEPIEPKHFFKKAMGHEMLQEWEKAIESYNMALLRDDQFVPAHRGLARGLRALGRESLASIHENKANSIEAATP